MFAIIFVRGRPFWRVLTAVPFIVEFGQFSPLRQCLKDEKLRGFVRPCWHYQHNGSPRNGTGRQTAAYQRMCLFNRQRIRLELVSTSIIHIQMGRGKGVLIPVSFSAFVLILVAFLIGFPWGRCFCLCCWRIESRLGSVSLNDQLKFIKNKSNNEQQEAQNKQKIGHQIWEVAAAAPVAFDYKGAKLSHRSPHRCFLSVCLPACLGRSYQLQRWSTTHCSRD